MYIKFISSNSEVIILLIIFSLFFVLISQFLGVIFLNRRVRGSMNFKKDSEVFFEKHALDMSHVSGICNTLEDRLCNVEKSLFIVEENAAACKEAIEMSNEQDVDAKIYSRALRMIKLGAGKEDVINDCELPEAEVDLLFRLHSNGS